MTLLPKAAHIYQLLLEEASGLRLASAELTGAIIEELGKQYMLSLQVAFPVKAWTASVLNT